LHIAGEYSFNNGKEVVEENYSHLLLEVKDVISNVDSNLHLTKESYEKTMSGRMLYNPVSLNTEFKKRFFRHHWAPHKVSCNYSDEYYVDGYNKPLITRNAYREMDFVKEKLGVEVQFGKYAFMVYNVCAKMTIFSNLGVINAGIEIVPIKSFAAVMSTGVSYFEQFVWDLEHRGVANIDIPVLILGLDN
jgi:hypothetical protein